MSPYDAHRELEYRKSTGDYYREKMEEDAEQERADRRQREVMGEDYPNQYRSY